MHTETTAQFGIIHGNRLGYSNQTLRGFISNLATTGNTRTPPTATEESAKQQAATTGPKLHKFWKAVSGQQRNLNRAIITAKKIGLHGEGSRFESRRRCFRLSREFSWSREVPPNNSRADTVLYNLYFPHQHHQTSNQHCLTAQSFHNDQPLEVQILILNSKIPIHNFRSSGILRSVD